MMRFETSVKTLASDFPIWCRIPHLENNFYIYGGGPRKIEPLPIYERSKYSADDFYKKTKFEVKSGLYSNFNPAIYKVHSQNESFMGLNAKKNPTKESFDSLNTKATLSFKNQFEPEDKTRNYQLEAKNKTALRSRSYEDFEKIKEITDKKNNFYNFKSAEVIKDIKNNDRKRLSKLDIESNGAIEKGHSEHSNHSSNISKKFEKGNNIEKNLSIRSGSVQNTKSENKAGISITIEDKNLGKICYSTENEGGILCKKPSSANENEIAYESFNSINPYVKQNSLKSEAISNRNSFFKVNPEKTEGKLTKSELESMEIYSILRKNGKNTEEIESKEKKENLISEEKPNSKSFESERKLIQEKLIEDFKRESLRREISRQNSLKYTGRQVSFIRKNSKKQTLQNKHTRNSDCLSSSHSSKQLTNKSFTISDSEFSPNSNSPTFYSQKALEINKIMPRQSLDQRFTKSFFKQNSGPRKISLSTKQSDSNYHQSTFTYMVKTMQNQSYTYSPNSKFNKTFPRFK